MAGPLHPVDGLVTRLIAQVARHERGSEETGPSKAEPRAGVRLTISDAARKLAQAQQVLESKLLEEHANEQRGRR